MWKYHLYRRVTLFLAESIEQVASFRGTAVIESDFDKMKEQVSDSEADYFLFKLYNPKEWLLITYVPDAVPVCSLMSVRVARSVNGCSLCRVLVGVLYIEDVCSET